MQKLPSRWKMARLGEVADYINGKAFKPSDWSNSGIPIIRIQNLTDKTKPFNFYQGECEPKYHVINGDILISWSASLGVFVWEQGLAYLNQHIFKAVPKLEIIDKSYFVYAISTAIEKMKRKVHGATMTHIVKSDFNKIKILLPPLPTQHKIVEILEEADNLRKLRQQADEKMKDLIPSLFVQMFGDPVVNKKNWPKYKLADLCQGKYGIKAGPFGSSIKKEIYTQSGYRIYGQEQVIAGDFSNGNYYISKEKFESMRAYEVKPNDLLISLVGTIGKVIIVPENIKPGIINPRLLKISPKHNMLNAVFLKELLQHPSIQCSLSQVAHGGTMVVLNAGLLKKLSVPLPPLPLQQEFAKLVEDIEAEKSRQAENRKKLGELFQSLMQRAFTGELVA